MTRLGVRIAEFLNNLIPPFAIHQSLDTSKQRVELYQEHEYREAQKVCRDFGPLWAVQNRRILDVGSGLGGKPVYYADIGASQVVGIDLRFGSSKATQSLIQERSYTSTVLPVLGDAAHLPFVKEYFDVIVSINAFEHIEDLYNTLEECRRVLRTGGIMFLHFPPFYSPWGAHLEGWIDFPWPHLFFSDQTLLEVAHRVETHRRKNQHYIDSAQVNWNSSERLPELNRVTVRQFVLMLQSSGFSMLEVDLLPFGRHYLAGGGLIKGALWIMFKLLCTLPVLQEVLTTKMVFVLKKI
jgi:SAM-dependent methyltransferase